MGSLGAEWDEHGRATITAIGLSGDGQITGLRPDSAMHLAIILARNARSYGASWPTPYWDDPYEQGSIHGLQTALGERSPEPPAEPETPALDLSEIAYFADELRRKLVSALDGADEIIGALRS